MGFWKEYMIMQDNQELEMKHCIWSGIVDSDLKRNKDNDIFKRGSDGEVGMLVPTIFHWS